MFPQVCFYSHLSHCFVPSLFVFGKTQELFLWGQGRLSSWSFLFQPLQIVQSFQQELSLLTVASSLENLLGEGRTGSFLNHEYLGLVVFSFLASTLYPQQQAPGAQDG